MEAETTTIWVRVAVETPFVVFHVSVLLFVAGEIRKRNAVFSTSFFVLYCVQSAVDIIYYLVVSDVDLRF